tara:strand:+ start:6143 stop:6655 length:513 start_codon:yes stop_codon:yes gene_type:complete
MSGVELLMIGTAVAGTLMETAGAVTKAETDGKIARENAKLVQNQSAEEARLASAEGRRLVAKARVRAGASGLSVDGSALDVIGELQAEGELKARQAIHAGRIEYDNFRAEQKAAKKAKTLAVVSGVAKVGTTVLTAGMSGAFSGAKSTYAASEVGKLRSVGKLEQMARGL